MKRIILFMILLMIPLVSAIDFCDDEVLPNTDCQLVSPEIACSGDLNVYNDTFEVVTTASVTQIGATNFYNYTFNQDTGNYLIVLCDNSSRQILVRNTLHNKSDTIINDTENILDDTQVIQNNQVVINDNILATPNATWEVNATQHNTTGTFGNIINLLSAFMIDPISVGRCVWGEGIASDTCKELYREIDNLR